MTQSVKKYLPNLLIILALIIAYMMSNAIWSFDSASYYRVDMKRFPMYTLWLRGWEFISTNHYKEFIVIAQVILGGLAIGTIFKTLQRVIKWSWHSNYLLLIPLLLPYFPPLLTAHNLTSEGLAYPLYLWMINYFIQFIVSNKRSHLLLTLVIFLALCFTRGQFIIVGPIFAVVYALYARNKKFKKTVVALHFLLLALSPIASKIIDASYHKAVHGFFVTTPYSYVNISTLPLYVAKASDSISITDKHAKHLFTASYNTIDSLRLTHQQATGTLEESYMVFHNNFPVICNQNFHKKARDYFEHIDNTPHYSSIPAEQTAKTLTYTLITNNWKTYLAIYWEGVKHGFTSIYILIFLLIVSIYGFIKFIKNPNKKHTFIVLSGLLLFSNALIVGLACHSIQRYLFYNYVLATLMCLLLFNPKPNVNEYRT